MKATELLVKQHDEVRAMFEHLLKPGGRSKATLEKLADSFAAHMTIEQELFYPAGLKVEEEELFPRSEKALGDRSEGLCAEMLTLFRTTMKQDYVRAVGRGGAAVTSASAPDLHA